MDPVPVSAYIISLYIAYMADVKRYKFSTIQNYLTIVKHLHRANDYQDPTKDNWLVQHVLKGAKRELGAAQDAATPIEPRTYFETEYCLFCGRRRVSVARYRMICLVLFNTLTYYSQSTKPQLSL